MIPTTGVDPLPTPVLPHGQADAAVDARTTRGKRIYAESFGVAEADLMPAFNHRVGAVFAQEAVLAAGGPAWNDPGLLERDRSIAILTALICDGVLGERLVAHLERAVRCGVDQHALEVLLTLLALYVGQARTSVAAETVQQFFRDRTEQTEAHRP